MYNANRRNSRTSTGRSRGGQPGNKNNLQHGFYSKLYSVETARKLRESTIDGEIDIARIKAHALFLLTPLNGATEEITENERNLLSLLNTFIISINTLERTRMLARGHGGEIGQTILEAIRELNPYEEL